eukprot:TRINITY_DN2492_c0_g1_i1.p1 TRINITY_DN2492_c0_g1~~TRINITY_DN2492_c0_g1_i1.p1  ORF type:complete len:1074 (-),score=296.49 TRINITY_DN2492_c0_g1_i1:16-3237(-)
MGIKQLTRLLRERGIIGTAHHFAMNNADAKQIILVDGLGLIFQRFKIFSSQAEPSPKVAGIFVDYERFANDLITWCDHFMACGVELQFYFDNSSGSSESDLKLVELKMRKMAVLSNVIQLQNVCRGSTRPIHQGFLPNLLILEAIMILQEKGVKVINAIGEADPLLIRDAQSPNVLGILAEDSDFYLASNIKYFPIDMIEFTRHGIDCRYFQSEAVATALDVPTNRIADFCILMGNDYTGHLWEAMQNVAGKETHLSFLADRHPQVAHVIEFIQKSLKDVPLQDHEEFRKIMEKIPELKRAMIFTQNSLQGILAEENEISPNSQDVLSDNLKNRDIVKLVKSGRMPGKCLRLLKLGSDITSVFPEFLNAVCPAVDDVCERARASLSALLNVSESVLYRRKGFEISPKKIDSRCLIDRINKKTLPPNQELETLLFDSTTSVQKWADQNLVDYCCAVTLIYLVRTLCDLGDPLPINEFDTLCLMMYMLKHGVVGPDHVKEEKFDMKVITLTTRYSTALERIMELFIFQDISKPPPHRSFHGELLRYLYYQIGEAPYPEDELNWTKIRGILGKEHTIQYAKLRTAILAEEKFRILVAPSSESNCWRLQLEDNHHPIVAIGHAFPKYLPHAVVMAAALTVDCFKQASMKLENTTFDDFYNLTCQVESGYTEYARDGSDLFAMIRLFVSRPEDSMFKTRGIHYHRYHDFKQCVTDIVKKLDPRLLSKETVQDLEVLKTGGSSALHAILPMGPIDIFNLKVILMMALGETHYAFYGLNQVEDEFDGFNLNEDQKSRSCYFTCEEGITIEGFRELFKSMSNQVNDVKIDEHKVVVTFSDRQDRARGQKSHLALESVRIFSRLFKNGGSITVPNPRSNRPTLVGASNLTLRRPRSSPWSLIHGNPVKIDESHLRYVKESQCVGILGNVEGARGKILMSRLTLMSMEEWTLVMILIGGDFNLKAVGDEIIEFYNDEIHFKLKVPIQLEMAIRLKEKVRPKFLQCLKDPISFVKSNLDSEISEIWNDFRKGSQSSQKTLSEETTTLYFEPLFDAGRRSADDVDQLSDLLAQDTMDDWEDMLDE